MGVEAVDDAFLAAPHGRRGTEFTGISGLKSIIPGYNLADPEVHSAAITRATCLNLSKFEQKEAYNDSDLLQILGVIDSGLAAPYSKNPQFFLITSKGDASAERADAALEISTDALRCLYRTLGFSEHYNIFYTARLFNCSYHAHYDADADVSGPPTSLIFTARFPRNSRCISFIMRVRLADLSCVVFLSGPDPTDLSDIRASCIERSDRLKVHPLYFLTLIADHRYPYLSSNFAGVWLELVLAETVTKMARRDWMTSLLEKELPDKLAALSDTDTLLHQLHATNTELSQCDTAMAFATKFGNTCQDFLRDVEQFRERGGYDTTPARYRLDLEDRIKFYLEMVDEVRSKLAEVKDRIKGQINACFSVIAQKNAKINLVDSRSMKTISVMTLAFLPLTLVTSIWTANLFHLENSMNWKVYIGITVGLTVTVFFCWWLYMRVSGRRKADSSPVLEALDLDMFDVGSVQDYMA